MSYQSSVGYAGDMVCSRRLSPSHGGGDRGADRCANAGRVGLRRHPGSFRSGQGGAFLGVAALSFDGRSMHASPRAFQRCWRTLRSSAGAPLLFICRSGARSRQAAIAMTSAGWAPCFNVSDGFEGPLDPFAPTEATSAVGGRPGCPGSRPKAPRAICSSCADLIRHLHRAGPCTCMTNPMPTFRSGRFRHSFARAILATLLRAVARGIG